MNIVERPKMDIFSPFVLNNLAQLMPQFFSPFFSMILAANDLITALFSIRYIFARFSGFIANPFHFCYIVESGTDFSVPNSVFLPNSLYLKRIERYDILTLNDEPLFFLTHRGKT